MTPYQTRVLAHLVRMAQHDKAYSWWAAKNYAEIDAELGTLPEKLTAEMKARQKSHLQLIEGGKNERNVPQ